MLRRILVMLLLVVPRGATAADLLGGAAQYRSCHDRRPGKGRALVPRRSRAADPAIGPTLLREPTVHRLPREPDLAPTRAALLTGRHEFASGVTHTLWERERLRSMPSPWLRSCVRPATQPASSGNGIWATSPPTSPANAVSRKSLFTALAELDRPMTAVARTLRPIAKTAISIRCSTTTVGS